MSFEPGTYYVEDLISSEKLEIGDGYRAKNSELCESGIPFARAGNINDGFKFDNADHLPLPTLWKVGRKISMPGDVVFTSKGTVGRFALVEPHSPQFVYSPQLCYWRSLDTSVLQPDYLYYWMNSREFLHQVGYLKGQTDMADYVSLRDQRRMTVTIPSIQQQRNTVGCLKPLDDRITLLRETNATLEAIAQAIFKSWFVDFHPVHAKMEGRQPEGMDEETAALFPDGFEESELGRIPMGWVPTPFLETVNVIGGGTPKTSVPDYWSGAIPWFSVVDTPSHTDVWVIDTQKHITNRGLSESSTKLLPTGTTIVSARGTVGRLALTGLPMTMNQSCYGLCGKQGDSFFTYFSTKRLISVLKQHAHGSVFDTITRETLNGVLLAYPQAACIQAFEAVAQPLMERIRSNVWQMHTLSDLRDTLLPRLISGRLRLPEAEAIASEHT